MSLCLSAGGVTLVLAVEAFSLSWMHSVERTEWREVWHVTEAGLVVESASVSGSGAGMEVPEGAVLRDGAWHYRPALPPLPKVAFVDAGRGAGDWRLCAKGDCRNLSELVQSRDGRFTLSACNEPSAEISGRLPPNGLVPQSPP